MNIPTIEEIITQDIESFRNCPAALTATTVPTASA